MPITTSTSVLFEHLTALGVAPDHAAVEGIKNALGIWPGDSPTDDAYPVLGYHVALSLDPVSLTCYLATAGKFVRYEWTPVAAMSFTCGIDRVTAVTETVAGEELTVVIELDAQPQTTIAHTETQRGPGETVVAATTARTARTTYVLSAAADSEDGPAAVAQLAAFSRGLRASVGI